MRASSSTAFRCWAAAVEAMFGLAPAAAASALGRCDPLSLCLYLGQRARLLAGPAPKYGCWEAIEGWTRPRKAHVSSNYSNYRQPLDRPSGQ